MTGFFPLVFKSSGKKTFRRDLRIPSLSSISGNSKYAGSLPVTYTNDAEAAQQWIDTHIPQNRPVAIGWDMESAPDLPWRKTIYTGPATVQISVLDAAMVLHIAQDDTGPQNENFPLINNLLSVASILKVGVGLDQDMVELYQWQQEVSRLSGNTGEGWVEEQTVVGRLDIGGVGGSVGATKSLKALAEEVCGISLLKARKLSMSNWAESPCLTTEQVAYAARDAWVAAAVLHELSEQDPRQFSINSLAEIVLENEVSIEELLEKAQARKMAKAKRKEILTDEAGDEISREDLTNAQLESLREVNARIRELVAPQPPLFEFSPAKI